MTMNPNPEEVAPTEPPDQFVYEYSDYYQPFWIRREAVVCAGPEDVSPISDCDHGHCGFKSSHTKDALVKLSWYWGGENGSN